MRIVWLVVLFALCASCAPKDPVDKWMAPIIRQMEAERASLKALPSDAPLHQRFARIRVLDQLPRTSLVDLQKSELSAEDKEKAAARLSSIMQRQEPDNLAVVMAYLPPEGWYLKSRYGVEVATTAFLVVQHSDLETWRRFVPLFEDLAKSGDVDPTAYAMMYDRLALAEGRPQRYGTQMACVQGELQNLPLENPADVDRLRADMGFETGLEQYRAEVAAQFCA